MKRNCPTSIKKKKEKELSFKKNTHKHTQPREHEAARLIQYQSNFVFIYNLPIKAYSLI